MIRRERRLGSAERFGEEESGYFTIRVRQASGFISEEVEESFFTCAVGSG
jgi:hypothetical protein